MRMNKIKRIVLSRTDNIGDVIYTLPMAKLIKQYIPGAHITLLARKYVADVVSCYPAVDDFCDWSELAKLSDREIAQNLKNKFDAVVHVFPVKRIARVFKMASVPVRIGTSHRLYHWWTCNKLLNFTRKNSNQHEAELNLKLLAGLKINVHKNIESLASLCELESQEIFLSSDKILSSDKFNLIIHPGTNGNTLEWLPQNFCELIENINSDKVNIILTGTDEEKQKFKDNLIDKVPFALDVMGQLSLSELVNLIQHADGLIANGTGPLHMAAVLGINTLGLYPEGRTTGPTRWQPLGKKAEYLVGDNSKDIPNLTFLSGISVQSVLDKLDNWY